MPEENKKAFIYANNLSHEFFRRDEEGNVTEVFRALDQVNVKVKQGDFVAILGANGSGKSTFAKHINALLTPSEGDVWLDGKNTSDKENIFLIRQMAGMVFQNPDNQIVAGVVEEDVAFGPENIGQDSEEIQLRVEQCLKQTGMYEERKKSPNHLSGGQKQRVAIAGILAMKPKCIILDEATAMLDPIGRKQVLDTIVQINKQEGITILLITHYMEEVVGADYVYVMKEGQVALEGTPKEVFAQTEKISDCRIQVPDVTYIARELRNAGINIAGNILTEEELVEAICQSVS